MASRENSVRLLIIALVVSILAIGGTSALLYSEIADKRDNLWQVEYELMDALGLGLVTMTNTILVTLDDSNSPQAAFNQSWMVYSGEQLVYWSAEALIAEHGVSSEESLVFDRLRHATNIVSDAFREWIEEPLRSNVTSGESFLLSPTVKDLFTNVVTSIDIIRVQAWTYEDCDHPYSRVALSDLELVDDTISSIVTAIEGLGSPP